MVAYNSFMMLICVLSSVKSRSTHLILVTFSFDKPVTEMSGNSSRPPMMEFWKLNTRFLNRKGSNEAKSKSLDPTNKEKQCVSVLGTKQNFVKYFKFLRSKSRLI